LNPQANFCDYAPRRCEIEAAPVTKPIPKPCPRKAAAGDARAPCQRRHRPDPKIVPARGGGGGCWNRHGCGSYRAAARSWRHWSRADAETGTAPERSDGWGCANPHGTPATMPGCSAADQHGLGHRADAETVTVPARGGRWGAGAGTALLQFLPRRRRSARRRSPSRNRNGARAGRLGPLETGTAPVAEPTPKRNGARAERRRGRLEPARGCCGRCRVAEDQRGPGHRADADTDTVPVLSGGGLARARRRMIKAAPVTELAPRPKRCPRWAVAGAGTGTALLRGYCCRGAAD